jgi:hypothetical protein
LHFIGGNLTTIHVQDITGPTAFFASFISSASLLRDSQSVKTATTFFFFFFLKTELEQILEFDLTGDSLHGWGYFYLVILHCLLFLNFLVSSLSLHFFKNIF